MLSLCRLGGYMVGDAMSAKHTKQQAGQKGGLATVAKHGADHMRSIGRRGASVTWQRYYLAPYGIGGYAMLDRKTNTVKAIR